MAYSIGSKGCLETRKDDKVTFIYFQLNYRHKTLFTILCVLMDSEIMSHRNMRTHCEKTSLSTMSPVS